MNINKDKFGNLIYNDLDIINLLYQGHTNLTSVLAKCETDDIRKFNCESDTKINIYAPINLSIEEFDQILQQDWFIPNDYQNLDICKWVEDHCPTENLQRVHEELSIFKDKNLINLLKWLKYFVDVCRENNVLWGVGRGSSVASYVLFLIGVHRIDSVKYNLDHQEFLR